MDIFALLLEVLEHGKHIKKLSVTSQFDFISSSFYNYNLSWLKQRIEEYIDKVNKESFGAQLETLKLGLFDLDESLTFLDKLVCKKQFESDNCFFNEKSACFLGLLLQGLKNKKLKHLVIDLGQDYREQFEERFGAACEAFIPFKYKEMKDELLAQGFTEGSILSKLDAARKNLNLESFTITCFGRPLFE